MRKFIAALVAAYTLLVAAQAEATGFRSRTVIRNNGRGRVVVNTFATPLFVQPTFIPVQPNIFVPVNGFNSFGFNGFGNGCCH